MPEPLSILNFIIVSLMCTAIAFVLSWRKDSNLFYKVALGNVYIGEIAISFLVFVLLIDSPFSPFTYNEKSSLKVFLDFFTIYQITVILFFKTIDGIEERPYHNYLFELKRVNLNLSRQNFDLLIKDYVRLSTKNPKYFYHDFFHLSRELLSLKLELFILKGVSDPFQTQKFKAVSEVSIDGMRDRVEQGEEKNYEESLNELKQFVENEITQIEIWLEENKDPWSGSIVLRLAFTNKASDEFKRIRGLLHDYLFDFLFIIINLMIILILTNSYL